MNPIENFKVGFNQLLEQREDHLVKISKHTKIVKQLLDKIKEYKFENAVFETREIAHKLHDLIVKTNDVDRQISECKSQFKNLILKEKVENPVEIYKKFVESIYTVDSVIIPELGVTTLTKLFYVIHKKKELPSPKDKEELRIAKIYASAKYKKTEEHSKCLEMIDSEVKQFENSEALLSSVGKL